MLFIRLIKGGIRILFWLQAFAAPVIFFGLIAFFFYSKGERYSGIAIVLSGIGVLSGIIVAEYIRRKIGLETFFAGYTVPMKWIKGPGRKRKTRQILYKLKLGNANRVTTRIP